MSNGTHRLLAVLAIAHAACASQHGSPRGLARPSAPLPSLGATVRRVEIPPLTGHSQPISTIAVSPSHRLVVTVSTDHTMSLWNLATGALVRTVHSDALCGRLIRATDEQTALVGCNGALREWDLRSGAETRVEKAHPNAFTVVMDREGRHALTASIGMDERGADGRQRIFLWDLDRLERVRTVAEIPGHVAQLAWSNDGRRALVRTYRLEDGIALIDIETGKTLRRFEPKSENAVDRLAFDPSGRRAIISHAGGPTLVFDTGTGRLEQRSERGLPPFEIGPEGQLLSMDHGLIHRDIRRLDAPTEVGWRGSFSASSWTPDRAHVVVAATDALRVIDTSSGSVIERLDYDPIGAWQAAIAPDGRTVALKRCRLGSSAQPFPIPIGSQIDIVSLETRAVVKSLRLENDEPCGSKLTFSGRGTKLLEDFAIDDTRRGVRIWDVASGKNTNARVGAARYELSPFSDDRTALLAVDGLVSRIDFDKIDVIAQYTPPVRFPLCSAVSPDGDLVMAASYSELHVWDAHSSKLLSTITPVSEAEPKVVATAAAFSPDGKLLALADAHSIRLHDPRSGALVRQWAVTQQPSMLRFIDGGTLACADSGGVVTLWNIQDGRVLATDTRSRARISDLLAVDGEVISASADTAVRLITVPRTFR